MSQKPRKLLLHLTVPLLPVDTGGKRKLLGTLQYFRERKDFFSVDVVSRNDFGSTTWTVEQRQEILKTANNLFICEGERNLLDFVYSRSKSFYHQKLLRQQMPVDTDYFTPPGYINFVRSLISEHKYDLIWINTPDYAHLGLKGTRSSGHPVHTILDIVDLQCKMRLARETIGYLKGLKFDYEANLKKKFDCLINLKS
jgi:hypothetical protein